MNNILFPNLVAEMAKRGETKKSIAKLLGVSNPTVSRKFSGKLNWNMSEIEILCKHFNKDYYELFIRKS